MTAPDSVSILTPLETGRYQWHACGNPGCPNVYKASLSNPAELCPACAKDDPKAEKRADSKRRYYAGRGWNHNTGQPMWTVLHDPLPENEGGLKPGVAFESLDFLATLAAGSWSGGLVAKFEGTTYTVNQDQLICEDGAVYRVYNGMLKRSSSHVAHTEPAPQAPQIPYYQRRKAARAQAHTDTGAARG
jgi:hypothetical protein